MQSSNVAGFGLGAWLDKAKRSYERCPGVVWYVSVFLQLSGMFLCPSYVETFLFVGYFLVRGAEGAVSGKKNLG